MSTRPKILRLLLLSLLTISLVLTYGLALGAAWRVDGQNGVDPTGCTRGTTWATAFKTIQKAIDCAAGGDDIWVKKGTYLLTSSINVNKEVKIYGGFSGTEIKVTQRNWKTNITTVNGRNRVRCFYVTATTTIDGFTIKRGYSIDYGGAIYADWSNLSVSNCTFTSNKAETSGGAIACDSLVLVQDCFFSDNETFGRGGAISTGGYAEVRADRCIFVRNRAESGGAIEGGGEGSEATNSIFVGNTATTKAGAIWGSFRWFHVGNCTFMGNYASDAAACRLPKAFRTPSHVYNSIFWDNRSKTGNVLDLYYDTTVTYTDIQGGYPGEGNINSDPRLVDSGFWWDKNNTPHNPLDDVYVVGDDFHLKPDSPCINAGELRAELFTTSDFEGDPRVIGPAPDMGADEYAPCHMNAKFQRANLLQGVTYYTDRTYNLTGVPSKYLGLDMIKTPNDDRYRTDASGYLTFTKASSGTVYVAYDRRATSLPTWMSGFANTGDTITTSLSTQGYLKVYKKSYTGGTCVDLGGNKAAGSSTEERSNYIVFYRAAAGPPEEVIIDNGGSGTSSTGTWLLSGGQDSYGTQSLYSKVSGSTYTFTADVTGLGDIYMWWTWYASRCTVVPVNIYNGTTLLGTVYVYQQDKARGAVWNKLGSYQFTGTAKVVIQATSSSCSTCADAVKFLSIPL